MFRRRSPAIAAVVGRLFRRCPPLRPPSPSGDLCLALARELPPSCVDSSEPLPRASPDLEAEGGSGEPDGSDPEPSELLSSGTASAGSAAAAAADMHRRCQWRGGRSHHRERERPHTHEASLFLPSDNKIIREHKMNLSNYDRTIATW